MSKDDKNLELARSWFVLAEILAIMSGLFMVAAGFFYIPLTDISNLHNNIRNFCNDIIQDDIPPYNSTFDCRDKYGGRFIDTAMKNLNFSGFFLSLGFIIAFFSLVIWYLGKQKIKNKDFNDELYGIILLILFSIILLYLYNKYS